MSFYYLQTVCCEVWFVFNKSKRKCEGCSRLEWISKGEIQKIPLELHHKNGNSHDHIQENLEILCPNCHVFTETYKGRNKAKKTDELEKIREEIKNINCVLDQLPPEKERLRCRKCGHWCKQVGSIFCSQICSHLSQRKVLVRPSKEVLEKEIKNTSFRKLAKKYGVSDNTIRKWMKAYCLEIPGRNRASVLLGVEKKKKYIDIPLF